MIVFTSHIFIIWYNKIMIEFSPQFARYIYTNFHHSKNLNYIVLRIRNISFHSKDIQKSLQNASLNFRTSVFNISRHVTLSLALNRRLEHTTEIRLWLRLRLLDHFIGDVVYTGFDYIDSPRPPSIRVDYAGQ